MKDLIEFNPKTRKYLSNTIKEILEKEYNKTELKENEKSIFLIEGGMKIRNMIEAAKEEKEAIKEARKKSTEVQNIQKMNWQPVTYHTLDYERTLMKHANAGIVRLLNEVATYQRQNRATRADTESLYEVLKNDKYDYKLPDDVIL